MNNISSDVKPGEKILINDGKAAFEVIAIENKTIKAKVLYGNVIENRKGVNIPSKQSSLKSITDKDLDYIMMAKNYNVDYIALSFVRTADDINILKQQLADAPQIKIIAKIEKPQAVTNIDEILEVSDGIMIARGDLGIEMPIEELPLIQKSLIKRAVFKRKFCIVATQMLESMISEPLPTRAEVNDVANAIIEGAHAVMLSAETSIGKYPVEAVKMMRKIADKTENYIFCY